MPVRSLMGVETEYALTALDPKGNPVDRGNLMEFLFAEAREVYPHVRDTGTGLFLANGARLYLDRGYHPEFATPECEDPWEAVRYIRAGERIMQDLAGRLRRSYPQRIREVYVFRANVEYDRSGTTWGCHESYLHHVPQRFLPPELIPHFVTRIIYAGAGGFNPLVPGAEFTVSPRAWLLPNVTARDSTGERGIFHFRDEPHAFGTWQRLHVICGESLCSDTAAVLRLGTTALILAAVDRGKTPGAAVRLYSPVNALRRIAADPQAPVQLEDGTVRTAVAIQRHYLAQVEHCRRRDLPAWAPELCRLWKSRLDALESAAASVERTLDWAIKRALFRQWVCRHMAYRDFQRISALVERIERVADRRHRVDGEPILTIPGVLGSGTLEAEHRKRLEPLLTAEQVSWDDVRTFARIRSELFEIDLRFGQLGERGIFEQLDRQGLLSHRLTRCESVDEAVRTPPAGRAAVRGRSINDLWLRSEAKNYRSDWTMLWNEYTGSHLDLSDPFVSTARWQ